MLTLIHSGPRFELDLTKDIRARLISPISGTDVVFKFERGEVPFGLNVEVPDLRNYQGHELTVNF